MAKICEWDSVKCPFCGTDEVEHNRYGILKDSGKDTHNTEYKVHIVTCPGCLGEFSIPCLD